MITQIVTCGRLEEGQVKYWDVWLTCVISIETVVIVRTVELAMCLLPDRLRRTNFQLKVHYESQRVLQQHLGRQ